MENIEALEVAKEEAYLAYAAAARALHDAYWNRLQEQLPEIIKLIGECYPAAVVETERTEWTNSDEFAFDHWVYIRFPAGLSSEEESAFYDWLQSAVSLSHERGQTFAVRR